MNKRKKNEEERKQRREEMAAKFPMQNPRTHVTSVLTKKAPATTLQGLGGLEAKRAEAGLKTAETVSDWLDGMDLGEKLKAAWERHGEAQKNYGEAMKQQSNHTETAAKRLWEQHQTNVGTLASAQAQQAQAKTKGLREAANSEIAQRVMNSFTEGMRRRSSNAETIADKWADGAYLAGKYSGVTGSDQTVASIYGMREDTSYKTPNDEWTDGERRLYEYHLKTNPEEAEAYAIRINNRHNQKKKNEKLQNLDDWINQSGAHGAVAWIGARGLHQVSGIDGYNKMLEYAAIGRNNISEDLSASDVVGVVDDVNERNIKERFGEEAGAAYRIGTDATDAIISRGINHLSVVKLQDGDKIRLNDVNEAIDAFNSSYLYARDNGMSELESVGLGAGNVVLNVTVGEGLSSISKESFDEKDVARVFMEEPINAAVGNVGIPGRKKWFEANDSELQERKGKYMKEKRVSERTAWWMATKELLEESMNEKNHPRYVTGDGSIECKGVF